MKGRRRTYRAHGSITSYLIMQKYSVKKLKKELRKKKKEDKKIKFVNPRKHIRNALTKAYAKKKFVIVGGRKK